MQAITPVLQQPQLPQFKDFIATPTGQYDELREYKNATTGEVRQIPFVGGQPIYPIPEGFTYQDPEATATEEVTTTPTTGQTQVQTATGAGGERDDFSPTSATTAAAKSLGYKGGAAGKVNIPALVGGLIGGPLVGMGLSALKGFGADDEESTYGQPGTIDPATGAIFGQADIPGLTKNSANVAQGFNPVTGQPMATFSGTPSASYMKDKIAMAFGFAQNPNATFTGLQIIDPMAPTPLAEQGFKSTADIIRENTALSLQGPSVGIAGPQPVSPEKLGFSKNQASYGLASKNKGTYGSETGQISQTAFGLGVVNESGQIETPSGTVVQKTDPTTGKKHSLLGTKEQNKAVLDMIDKNIQNSKTVAQSLGMAADAAAAVSSGDNDGPNKGDFGNASSGTGSKGYGGGIGTGGGGKGESFGPHGGFNKGGNVTKQMKKSGLSSKK